MVEVLGGGKADFLNVDENEGFIETMRSNMAQLLYLGRSKYVIDSFLESLTVKVAVQQIAMKYVCVSVCPQT